MCGTQAASINSVHAPHQLSPSTACLRQGCSEIGGGFCPSSRNRSFFGVIASTRLDARYSSPAMPMCAPPPSRSHAGAEGGGERKKA